MTARTDESAPLRVFWAYGDDGKPELRLGYADERSPMRLLANGSIERVFYSDPNLDGPINIFGEHRDSVVFDALSVVTLLEAAGWACLPPPPVPRTKLAIKRRDAEMDWTIRVLKDEELSGLLQPGQYATINGEVGRIVAVRQCQPPKLDLDHAFDLQERLEELAIDHADPDEFGVWDDQFIELDPNFADAWAWVWRNFAARHVANDHHKVIAGDGPATPETPDAVIHVTTMTPREGVIVVDGRPEACHACGHTELFAGYGLAGGGMGSYWICAKCDKLHKSPEPLED